MAIDLAQRFAAAAAVTDPSLLMRVPPSEPAPRPRRDLGGAPLIALAVAGRAGVGEPPARLHRLLGGARARLRAAHLGQ